MTTRGTIIKGARILRRKTQAEVAQAVNVSPSVIYRLEADDSRVELDTVGAVAQFLGATFDWYTGKVTPPADLDLKAIEQVAAQRRGKPPANGSPAIPPGIGPVVDTITVPEWDIDLRASHWAPVPCAQLDTNDPEQRAVVLAGRFRLRILGKCMEPEYPDGMLVEFRVVVLDAEPLVPGADYAVCRSDGTATFKRLVRVDEDTMVLAALNQKAFPGRIEVPVQEVCRIARVEHRLAPPPAVKRVKV